MTAPPAAHRVRRSPAAILGAGAGIAVAGVGLVFSRPDVVLIALPLMLSAALALTRRARGEATVTLTSLTDAVPGRVHADIDVESDAEMVELHITQAERRTRGLLVAGRGTVHADSRTQHSGPLEALRVTARTLDEDAMLLGPPTETQRLQRSIMPPVRPASPLPLPAHLTGLHGSHEGRRPGQGGDFRDIHPFAPGDELRRVDWRATARLARKPGELFVRRTNTLSDASVVIAMDTVDDLGEVVASWGTGDLTRSGVTSLDQAREAARSIATAAVNAGDRVSFHTLVHGGRSLRSGGGSRHLARLNAAIAATGVVGEESRFRRTPPVPHGSVIYVLSTFFDGAAAQIALMWRASGHRVIAVDTLPDLDTDRLSREQGVSLRTLLVEREDMFHDLASAGVDTFRWSERIAAEFRSASVRPVKAVR